MDYLNTTIIFLEQQNKELKEKLKRAQDLHNIMNEQRTQQQKDYLTRLHREEINVIRQMAAENENHLKKQIKQLKTEIQELTTSVIAEEDAMMKLKRDLQKQRIDNEDIEQQNRTLKKQIEDEMQRFEKINDEYDYRYRVLEKQFKERQENILNNYLQRLQENNDKHEEEMSMKEKIIDSQVMKLESIKNEKIMLEDQLERLMIVLKEGDRKNIQRNTQKQEENTVLKQENERLSLNIKNLEIHLFQLQEKLKEEKKGKKVLQHEVSSLKKKLAELEQSKNREILREKSKTVSVCKDLTDHKKYIKSQIQTSKKMEKEYTLSKKLLINRIKQTESKPGSCKSSNTSFLDKSTLKTLKKPSNLESYQSISLDNSFSKDSPSVSCFLLRQEKSNTRAALPKKPLTIQTSNHQTMLRFQNLDTPCFQSAKDATKKTIRIKK